MSSSFDSPDRIAEIYHSNSEEVANLLNKGNVSIRIGADGQQRIFIGEESYGDPSLLAWAIINQRDRERNSIDLEIAKKLETFYKRSITTGKEAVLNTSAAKTVGYIRTRLLEITPSIQDREGSPPISDLTSEESLSASRLTQSRSPSPGSRASTEELRFSSEEGKTAEDLDILMSQLKEKVSDSVNVSNQSSLSNQEKVENIIDQLVKVELVLDGKNAVEEQIKRVENRRKSGQIHEIYSISLSNGKQLEVSSEYIDSVQRGPRSQIRSQYAVLESVENPPLNEFSQHSEVDPHLAFLGKLFIEDLVQRLGPERSDQMLGRILTFLEQCYTNYLSNLLLYNFKDFAVPHFFEVERNIEISEDKVVLLLSVAFSEKYLPRGEGDDIDDERRFPFPVKAFMQIELGGSPEDQRFSVNFERGDSFPVSKSSNRPLFGKASDLSSLYDKAPLSFFEDLIVSFDGGVLKLKGKNGLDLGLLQDLVDKIHEKKISGLITDKDRSLVVLLRDCLSRAIKYPIFGRLSGRSQQVAAIDQKLASIIDEKTRPDSGFLRSVFSSEPSDVYKDEVSILENVPRNYLEKNNKEEIRRDLQAIDRISTAIDTLDSSNLVDPNRTLEEGKRLRNLTIEKKKKERLTLQTNLIHRLTQLPRSFLEENPLRVERAYYLLKMKSEMEEFCKQHACVHVLARLSTKIRNAKSFQDRKKVVDKFLELASSAGARGSNVLNKKLNIFKVEEEKFYEELFESIARHMESPPNR